MKLLRFGEAGAEKPGAIDADGRIRDLSAHVDDIGPDELDDAVIERLRALDLSSLPAVPASIRRGPPCLLYTSPSPRDRTRSRMPSSA